MALYAHTDNVQDAAFSLDGTRLATASWDTTTGQELFALAGHSSFILSVAFSPDGIRLAVASRDGTNRIYLLRIEDLIALAKQRVTRSLTTEECQQYLHVTTCPPQ